MTTTRENKRWRRRAGIGALLAAVVGLAPACGVDDRSSAGGGVLRVAGPFEVHSLDPVTSDGFFTRLEVVETLVTSDLQGELAPGLATRWDDSRDGSVWTFELVEDVTFHDGTPLDADAVVGALELAAAEEASPLAGVPIDRIVADGSAVRFELTEPHPTLPAVLTHYSAAVLAPASYDDDGHVTDVIGTGPYQVERVELPASIEVTRYDGWRGEAPDVEEIRYQAVGRAESRALMATSDQADVVFHLEPAGQERVDAGEGVRMEATLQPRTVLLKVNADHPVLGDERVRRALSLALDREAMADAVLRDPELAATQLMPPSLEAWHDPGLPPLVHDPDEARRLLAEAGWSPGPDGILTKDGEPLRLTLLTYPDRTELPPLATAIQASLKEVGIDLEVDVTNSSEIPAGHADGSLDLALLARHFALVADPLVTVADTFAPEGSDWGAMNWEDPAVTAAVRRLLAGAPEAQATELRTTITSRVQESLPLVPVAWYRMNAAVTDDLDGFVIDPLETSWHFSRLSWAE